jgi:signal peptidase I
MTMEHETLATPKTKKRHPLVAFLLSFFILGLGQIYNGQAKKGAIVLILLLLSPIFFGYTRCITTFAGTVTALVIESCLRLYSMIDAIAQARRQKEYIVKKYNRWYWHLLIAIGVLLLFFIYNMPERIGVANFRVCTTANQPILKMNDKVLVDMRAYETKEPEYGDLVVFYNPKDNCYYMYRIIGKPGDIISLKNHSPVINSVASTERFIGRDTCDDLPVNEYEETLPNGNKHRIYKKVYPLDSLAANMEECTIPRDTYFLLGDNRDNAADSRYIGAVNKEFITGKIVFCLWGDEKGRINIDLRNK